MTAVGVNHCVACGGRRATPLYRQLLRCDECGHAWADVALTDGDVATIYDDTYFRGSEYDDYLRDRIQLERNFELRLERLSKHVDKARHRRLLEVGSAYGFFLNLAKSRFETVEGIEISPGPACFARDKLGLTVLQGDIDTLQASRREYDVVCLWDTIEHLRRPDLALELLSEHLTAGGLIAVTTGDLSSVNARLRQARWRLIHPPSHLHYFTRTSITRLMDGLGFTVVDLYHCGFYRSLLAMMAGVVGRSTVGKAAVSWLSASPLHRTSIYLNLFDIMSVIGVKRAT